MKNYLILFLVIFSVIQVNATVSQLGKLKLKDTVVTAVQSDNDTITVDENSNISTNYRGMSWTNFVITAAVSNEYYKCVKSEMSDIYSIYIYCQPRTSVRFETSLELSSVLIYPPKYDIAGIKDSFFEFDCLSTSSFSVQYDPSIVVSGINRTFYGDNVRGSSTNLVMIGGYINTKFYTESTSLTPLN